MLFRILADLVLLAHLAFVIFALLGGLLVLRYRNLLWPHLAALAWGVAVQWANWICPLTPLENALRRTGGEAGYAGGVIEHYAMRVLYPDALPLELRYLLGLALILVNGAVYAYVLSRKRRRMA